MRQYNTDKCYKGEAGVTRKRKENPQKALSKEWIARALQDLMQEKPYQELTITEVASRADLSRRTFYRHFLTIDDVLHYTLEAITDQFIAFLMEETQDGAREVGLTTIVFLFFTYWERHKELLLLLKENDMLFLLLQKFFPKVRARLHGEPDGQQSATTQAYVFSFAAGGAWNLLVSWVEAGAVQSPREMERVAAYILEYVR